MSSSDFPDLLDLDRGLPTSREDVEILRRLRNASVMTLDEYFQFCASLPQPAAEELASRPLTRGAPVRLE